MRAWRRSRTLFVVLCCFHFGISIVCCHQYNEAPRYVPWLGSATCWVRSLSFPSCHDDWVLCFLNICSLIFWVKDSHMKETLRFGVPEERWFGFVFQLSVRVQRVMFPRANASFRYSSERSSLTEANSYFGRIGCFDFEVLRMFSLFFLLSEVTMFIKHHKKYWLILMLSISPYGQPAAGSGRLASCTLLRS